MRILSLKTVSWLVLILSTLLMFGCGDSPKEPDPKISINLNGGNANSTTSLSTGGWGGDANINAVGALTMSPAGSVDATFTLPPITVNYGFKPYIVGVNEEILLDAEVAGKLYVVTNDANLYLGDGDAFHGVDDPDETIITGLEVPAGITLTLPDNFTFEFYAVLNNDIVIDGELNTVNESSDISLDAFNGNLLIGSTGVVTTKPGSNGKVGGSIDLFAGLTAINEGLIDGSGADSTDATLGGNGGLSVTLTAFEDLYNTGILRSDGGNNSAVSAGNGGDTKLLSSEGSIYSSGKLSSNGGSATINGGQGGNIFIETTASTPREILISGTLQVNGGDATNGNGGDASANIEIINASLTDSLIMINADLESKGGTSTGANLSGGNGFTVKVSSTLGSISMTGHVDVTGGDGDLAGGDVDGGVGGAFEVTTSGGTGNIDLIYDGIIMNGGDGKTGGDGGDLIANSVATTNDFIIRYIGGNGATTDGVDGSATIDGIPLP